MTTHYKFRAILVGNNLSGKTSILKKSLGQDFNVKCYAKVDIDYGVKTLLVGDDCVKLGIWDTGRNRFRLQFPSSYKRSLLMLIILDLTDRSSFESLDQWKPLMMERELNNRTNILIGNKCDLSEERAISWDSAKEFADKYNMFYIETSAKTGFGIEVALKTGVEIILNKIKFCELNEGLVDLAIS